LSVASYVLALIRLLQASVTVSVAGVLVTPPPVAVIDVVPFATPVATPLVLTVAISGFDEVHVTAGVATV
jgi:hypothetical protein